MPQKRMFSLAVVDTDAFLDMPISAQALYFHFGMHSDDDGFISNPKRISRTVGCNNDDIKILIQKGFIIPFENGVVVIRDWKINNTLKNDRYKPTLYTSELNCLKLDASGRYIFSGVQNGTQMEPKWVQNGTQMEPQPNVTKINLDKPNGDIYRGGDSDFEKGDAINSCETVNETPAEPVPARASSTRKKFIPPSLDEVAVYCNERHNGISPSAFIDYYEARGWKYGTGKPMVNWKAAVRTWEQKEKGRTHTQGEQQKKATEEVNARIFEELFGGEPT